MQLAGQPDGNPRKLRALIAQPVNAPYAQAKVDETVAALKKAGDFKDVEVQVTPAAEGVHVVFVLKPAYYFGVYTFPKAEKTFSYTRLLQAANYSKQEPFTQEKVEEAESSLLEFFHRTGFFLATVEPKMQTDQEHGVVNVEYDINLKKRAKFGDVILAGVSEEQTKRLNASLRQHPGSNQRRVYQARQTVLSQETDSGNCFSPTAVGKTTFPGRPGEAGLNALQRGNQPD